MSRLKKCKSCNKYSLENNCPKCKKQTKDAHYKFIKVRNAPNNK